MQFEKTIIMAARGLTVADLNGETILLDGNSGSYYGLNEVGARILALVEDPISLSQLVDMLSHEYNIETGHLEEELQVFLQELVQLNLIQIENKISD